MYSQKPDFDEGFIQSIPSGINYFRFILILPTHLLRFASYLKVVRLVFLYISDKFYTCCILLSCLEIRLQRIQRVRIDNSTFERVEQVKYFGIILTNQNSIAEEMKSRLRSGNACYHPVQNLYLPGCYPKI